MVFGKNSARPRDEVQEVVYFPAADHEPESKVEVSDASQSPGGHPFFLWLCPACLPFFVEACSLVRAVLSALLSPISVGFVYSLENRVLWRTLLL